VGAGKPDVRNSPERKGGCDVMALPIRHPAGGLLPRIAVEEAELARVLGDQYRS